MNRDIIVVGVGAAALIGAVGAASSVRASIIIAPVAVTEATQTHALFGPGQGTATFSLTATTSNFNWNSQISNAGSVSFRASSSLGTFSTTGNGVWGNTGAGNSSLAFAGGLDSGGGAYGANTYSNRMSQGGFVAAGHGSGSNANTGIVAGPVAGPMTRVGYVGDIAPGTGGATYNTATTPATFLTPMLSNSSGQVLFQGVLTTGTGTPAVVTATGAANNTALFLGTGGAGNPNSSVVPVLRMNDDASSLFARPTGATGTLNVGTISSGPTVLNDNGRFVTFAGIQSTTASDLVTTGTGNDNLNNNSALFTNRAGTLQSLARRGDFAPDTTGAISANHYGTFSASNLEINNSGRVAFQTRLTSISGSTVTSVATAVLYSDHDNSTGTLKEIVRSSTALPTIYDPSDTGHTTPITKYVGRTWGAGMSARMPADNSLIVSASGLGGTGAASGGVLRRDTDGFWTSLYAAGDVALPGGASDGTNVLYGVQTTAPSVNAAGQIAMLVNLTGTGIQSGNRNNLMLVATDQTGALIQVARLGDFWDYYGDGTDFRQIVGISTLGQAGAQDGSGCSFNDYGKLVFELQFGDPRVGQTTPNITSSGIYTAWLPAPGTAGVLALGSLLGARRRRSR